MASDETLRRWPLATVRWWVAMLPLALFVHAMWLKTDGGERVFVVAATAACVVLSSLPWLFPAILSRGALWFTFLGTCLAVCLAQQGEAPSVMRSVLPLAWTLLVLGRPDVSTRDGAFVPVAFRGTLLAAMLLGAADAYWLGGASVLFFNDPFETSLTLRPFVMAAGSVVALASVWGLSRLKLWGVLLGLLCNAGVLAFVAWAALRKGGGDAWLMFAILGGGALVHTLLQVPLVLALVRGRPPAWAHRDFKWVGNAVVSLLTALAVGRILWDR